MNDQDPPTKEEQLKTLSFVGRDEIEKLGITPNERAILALLARVGPVLGVAKLYALAELASKDNGNRAKAALIARGWVSQSRFKTGKRGNNPCAIELTAEGKEAIRKLGYQIKSAKGEGKPAHKITQQELQRHYRKAFPSARVQLEAWRFGKRIDLLIIYKDGSLVAVQVVNDSRGQLNHAIHHVRRAKFTHVIFVCVHEQAKQKLTEQFTAHLRVEERAKITIQLASEILK